MKKLLKNWLFWLIFCIAILLFANIAYQIWGIDYNKSNYLTIISGWVSGLATLTVGIIAYYQAKKYKIEAEIERKYTDIAIERIEITTDDIPADRLGRRCISKDAYACGMERLKLLVFNISDSLITDISILQLESDKNKKIIKYDLIQPMQSDIYGKTFLNKNEALFMSAGLPRGVDIDGHYILTLEFRNQFNDVFEKKIELDIYNKSNLFRYRNVIQHETIKI